MFPILFNQWGWDHYILLKSTPYCTISHNGDISLNFSTFEAISSTAASTYSSVVNLPIPILREVWAKSSDTPRARKT